MNAAHQHKPKAEVFQRNFSGTWDDIFAAAAWLDDIAHALNLPDQTLFNMQVCLEEIFTNIVKHGGSDVQTKSAKSPIVALSISSTDEATVLAIEDNAKPFDVAAAEAHAIDRPLSELKPGGLGVQLIKSFANEIAYEPAGLGNRVILRFLH